MSGIDEQQTSGHKRRAVHDTFHLGIDRVKFARSRQLAALEEKEPLIVDKGPVGHNLKLIETAQCKFLCVAAFQNLGDFKVVFVDALVAPDLE